MSGETRKATDVILSLEQKIDNLTKLTTNNDLLLKVISSKLTELIALLIALSKKEQASNITIESVDNNIYKPDTVVINSEDSLAQESAPKGFRRTSRPETFAGDNFYLPPKVNKPEQTGTFPIQIPVAGGKTEILNKKTETASKVSIPESNKSVIPTQQRIVDKNGKSVFLAEVEILNIETKQIIAKSRTNGVGKWSASLPIGDYLVVIKKTESLTKEKLEIKQNIHVDGSSSPLELSMMIIK